MRVVLGLAMVAALCAPLGCGEESSGDDAVDPQLAKEIAAIKAIDNHAHPVRPTAPGEPLDREFDALPVDNLEAQSDPYRQRKTSPIVHDAGKALYNTTVRPP